MDKKIIDSVTKALVDKGLLIEGGWKGFELGCLPEKAGDVQRKQMRIAFFAGAQHLFASIMSFLEEGSEPTDKDMDRMTQISNELQDFAKVLEQRIV